MTERQSQSLTLPAIRAHMGDWIYYITFLTLREVAARISIAEDIHTSKSLRDFLQRRLTTRSTAITRYLLMQPQRFFNALVIATYGGEAQWHEIALRNTNSRLEQALQPREGALGVLTLSGSEKMFAIDGQHRVAGIKAAVNERRSIGKEEVCVILLKGVTQEHRSDDEKGFERTRRLFTTLNRYAKPVSKKDIIALDEDDIVAIVTRRMVEEHPLFREKVTSQSVNSIHPRDRSSFTTITVVYDALDTYLPPTRRGWTHFKKLRPPEQEINEYIQRSNRFWDALVQAFGPLQEMRDSARDAQVAAAYRRDNGGHLLFRPVGLLLVVRVLRRLTDGGATFDEALRLMASVEMELAGEPWAGLLWDTTNRRMIITGEHKRAAEKLLVYIVGGDLAPLKSGAEALKSELAGVLNIPLEEYSLPSRLP